MSILNIFKKKKVEIKKVEEKPSVAKVKEDKRPSFAAYSAEAATSAAKAGKATEGKEEKIGIKGKAVLEGASSVLLVNPYLSEKSTNLREKENKYIFKVNPRATKNEIKKLLENIYNIEVTKINVINTPAKPKRWRQKKSHFRKNKKMMVTIKKGQKIELGI
mgnify:CR=1 FL=1